MRKDIRLHYYDYSNEGYYFITICVKKKLQLLSEIKGEKDCYDKKRIENILTKKGSIVEKYIKELTKIYQNVELDEYIIMPNHIHILLIINQKGKNTVSKIVQQMKGKITKEIGYSIWQKSFYEHIIRNENEYLEIKKYIQNNPCNWEKDKYY